MSKNFLNPHSLEILDYFTLQQSGLDGGDIVRLLRKGHVVRRKGWIPGLFARITNDNAGYDAQGNVIVTPRSQLYTIGSHGYFLHLGYSGQFVRDPVFWYSSSGGWELNRSQEGMSAFFEEDWEDYGPWLLENWRQIVSEQKKAVYQFIKDWNEAAKKAWEANHE